MLSSVGWLGFGFADLFDVRSLCRACTVTALGFITLFLFQLYKLARMLFPKFSTKLEAAKAKLNQAGDRLSWCVRLRPLCSV